MELAQRLVTVGGQAADGEEALRLVAETGPDVVLMDLRMPRLDGVEATRRIRTEHPATQVIALTTYADDASIISAVQAGARGYLTKDSGGDQLRHAIETVVAGEAQRSRPSRPGCWRRWRRAGPACHARCRTA